MIPRIKDIKAIDDFQLIVTFDDGFCVCYDVKEDIDTIDDFKSLKQVAGLWSQVKLDSSRTCIYWNDRIDLPSDMVYEYGSPIHSPMHCS